MSAEAQADLSGLQDFRNWKPEYQQRALDLLAQRERVPYKPFYCPDKDCDGKPHGEWAFNHARKDQRPPPWSQNWLTWVLSGGRGSGKTRPGSEVTHRVTELTSRIGLIAPTGPDFRDTMVEGESGLLATAPPDKMPEWEPSKKRLTWPNGCIAQGFSAEEPDRLRGPQFGYVWADEPAHYDDTEKVWDMMLFGLRLKGRAHPKVVATSTPKPTKWMRELLKRADTIVNRVSTYENIDNLAPTFAAQVLQRYEGTRIGRQELHGEMLEDVEGALWDWDMFRWVEEAPALKRIVVAVDPAGTTNKRSDETGIMVLGIGNDNVIYILEDVTGKYSPERWADKIDKAMDWWKADAIVVETTYGKDMVRYVLRNSGLEGKYRIIDVDSRRGKEIRAEPIVALYEKGRVKHVGQRGDLSDLEDEQTSWVPGEGASPNRVDALVHGATDLAKRSMPAQIATPGDYARENRERVAPHSPYLGGRQ